MDYALTGWQLTAAQPHHCEPRSDGKCLNMSENLLACRIETPSLNLLSCGVSSHSRPIHVVVGCVGLDQIAISAVTLPRAA